MVQKTWRVFLYCVNKLTLHHVTGNGFTEEGTSSSDNKRLPHDYILSRKCATVRACFKTYWVEWPSWRSVIPCAIPSPTWDLQGWERGIRSTTEAPGRGYYYSAGTDWMGKKERGLWWGFGFWGVFCATITSVPCHGTQHRQMWAFANRAAI